MKRLRTCKNCVYCVKTKRTKNVKNTSFPLQEWVGDAVEKDSFGRCALKIGLPVNEMDCCEHFFDKSNKKKHSSRYIKQKDVLENYECENQLELDWREQ